MASHYKRSRSKSKSPDNNDEKRRNVAGPSTTIINTVVSSIINPSSSISIIPQTITEAVLNYTGFHPLDKYKVGDIIYIGEILLEYFLGYNPDEEQLFYYVFKITSIDKDTMSLVGNYYEKLLGDNKYKLKKNLLNKRLFYHTPNDNFTQEVISSVYIDEITVDGDVISPGRIIERGNTITILTRKEAKIITRFQAKVTGRSVRKYINNPAFTNAPPGEKVTLPGGRIAYTKGFLYELAKERARQSGFQVSPPRNLDIYTSSKPRPRIKKL